MGVVVGTLGWNDTGIRVKVTDIAQKHGLVEDADLLRFPPDVRHREYFIVRQSDFSRIWDTNEGAEHRINAFFADVKDAVNQDVKRTFQHTVFYTDIEYFPP